MKKLLKEFKTYFHINNGGFSISFEITKKYQIPLIKIKCSNCGIKTNEIEILTNYDSIIQLSNQLNDFIKLLHKKEITSTSQIPIASIRK